ncbi:MAG: radical SAM protein [Nannocystaceae bacterium]|nr:radical SAM protein [Nannocystaceae bacterium]
MKALIKVGYACNENCTFCHTQDVRHIQGDAAEIERKIDRAAALGHSMVVLSGGEPTIRPELQRWAARVARAGLDFGLVTNGLMLAYPHVLDPLLSSRLRYVNMSLHGGEAKIHERMVRADSWEAANAALDNLNGRGLQLTINCVVTQHNVEHLDALVDRSLRWPDAVVKFSACEPKGGGLHLMGSLVPRLRSATQRVAAAISRGRALAGDRGPRFVHGGFPLCMLPGLDDAYDDLRTHGFRTMVEIGEPDLLPIDDANTIKPEVCEDCRLAGACPGLFAEYHRRFGAEELQPVTHGTRGNAFDWVFEGRVPAEEDTCPLLVDGVAPWDRARDLFVRHRGKVGRYRAEGRDFSDAQLTRIKHTTGQVYLDASRKPAPDDFPRDLVKLTRSEACRGCSEELGCTGMFEPVMEDLFSRDDARVREIVAGLTGDVLDVGCGDGPYDDVLAPAVSAGAIRWVGLEPNAAAVARLAQRRSWGQVHAVTAEDSDAVLAEMRFDHILMLRSWNHLSDPGAAIAAVVPRLRDGGTLLVVDNVAFGLARTPAQRARNRRARPPLEHWRNDDAAAAERCLLSAGLVVIERREVTPETANQWLVHARVGCR